MLRWSISDVTLAQYQALDAIALANYTQIYTDYYNKS